MLKLGEGANGRRPEKTALNEGNQFKKHKMNREYSIQERER
jgi:hypothetical protein